MISDTQRWYNSTEDVVKALNARGDIDFVILFSGFSQIP